MKTTNTVIIICSCCYRHGLKLETAERFYFHSSFIYNIDVHFSDISTQLQRGSVSHRQFFVILHPSGEVMCMVH